MELLAAYLTPAQQSCRPGPPGTKLYFRQGRCSVTDVRQIPFLLRMPDVTLQIPERYVSHVWDWLAACGENRPARAKVAFPSGVVLEPPYEYPVVLEEPEPAPDADAPVEPSEAAPTCSRCASGKMKGAARRTHLLKAHGIIT